MSLDTEINRYFIDISYKGTNYHGWQKQTNSNTIQQTIENTLKLLIKKEILIYGSGRTDAGVHAKQQIAHLDLDKNIDSESIKYKLNKLLPNDITINDIKKVDNKAHARFDAIDRTYEYLIIQQKDPFLFDRALLFIKELDLNKLNEASKILLIKDNFKSFCKSKTSVNNYKCKITKALWTKENHIIKFTITSNRFLRGMVRAIVGTIIEVGLGNINIDQFENIIDIKDRREAKNISPKGLHLSRVNYNL